MALNASEKALVTKTFAAVSGDLAGAGAEVFVRMLAAHPDYKSLFPFGNSSDMRSEASFKQHTTAVLTLLAKYVSVIDNDAEVKAIMDNFGVAHVPRKLSAAHFDNLATIFVALLKEKGAEVNAEAATAWAKVMKQFAATCT